MSPQIFRFGNRPNISLDLFIKDSQLDNVHLGLSSDGFVCHSYGAIPSLLLNGLKEYSQGKHSIFSFPFFLAHLPLFTQKVLASLQEIPFGVLITYGEIAKKIGHPKAARAVGTACGRNPYPLFIPCHRVISSTDLGGFSLDPRIKQELIQFESVK